MLRQHFFTFLAEYDEQQEAANRIQRIQEHQHSLACCWPEWKPTIGGHCEVGSLCATDVNGTRSYRYCAPCLIRDIQDDGETFIVEISYPDDAPQSCRADNGTLLRLDILDLWAPVHLLAAERYRSRDIAV